MQQINDVIVETLSLVQHELQVDGIIVATECRDDLPQIHADRLQIQQVILNLIKNAIEAMRSSPRGKRRLRVVSRLSENSDITVSIQDTGPGIDVKDRENIFDPFFSTKAAGTGLGLAICRTIIEDHGGKLRLTETDFRGSTFELAFPLSSTSDTSI
jgi:signal transduction histidine kinase